MRPRYGLGPLLALLALALHGCTCASPGTGADAAAGPDAGPRDATVFDAPMPRDAGSLGDAGSGDAGPSVPDAGIATDAAADADASTTVDAAVPDDAQIDAGVVGRAVTCRDPAPPGAPHADPPRPYGSGMCPAFVPGRNTLRSSGDSRQFLLVVPSGFDPTTERLPLVFLWHWLGGNANAFLTQAAVQSAADRLRFIAVIPESSGRLRFQWPYLVQDPSCVTDFACNCDCRLERELRYFDDLLACVSGQFPINLDCVSSVGASAGALWTAQLAPRRSTQISSMIVLSGGVGTGAVALDPGTAVRAWPGEAHAVPAFVLWGGPSDFCFLLFQDTSRRLEGALASEGAFVEECIHNCMHSLPPFAAPPGGGQFDALWDFALSHPYWLEDGESPYQVTGLSAGTPEWCAIGSGRAVERVGECPGTTPVLGSCI